MLDMRGVIVCRWYGMISIASINYKMEWNGIKLWSFGGTILDMAGLVCRKLVDADGSSLNGNFGMILALASTSGDVSKLADKTLLLDF